MFITIIVFIFKANIVNHDETPHYASSHMGLDRLHMSRLWEVRLIVVVVVVVVLTIVKKKWC